MVLGFTITYAISAYDQ